jgi:DnaJ domain
VAKVRTTDAQRRQLDRILLHDIALLEKSRLVPTPAMLAKRLWPVWGAKIGLPGGSMLALVKRQLQSLKIEGLVGQYYGWGRNSDVQGWGLTGRGLARFGLFRPLSPEGSGTAHYPFPRVTPPPPPDHPRAQTQTNNSNSNEPAKPRVEVSREVFAAATLLGVSPLDTPERIQEAYRRWAKSLHPDRNPNPGDATKQLQRINAARDLLIEFANSRQRS